MIKNFFKISLIAIFMAIVSGCSSATTSIKVPVNSQKRYSSFVIEENNIGTNISAEQKKVFEKKLTELFLKDKYTKGDGLKVKYSFLAYNEGNRFVRYMIGFGAGKGKIVIKTTFYDARTNQILGETETESELSIGLFGGSMDETFESAAEDIYKFAKTNYMK